MAHNGRPADHSGRGSGGIKTRGRELFFEFHALQTRAYEFSAHTRGFLGLLLRNAPHVSLASKCKISSLPATRTGISRRTHLILSWLDNPITLRFVPHRPLGFRV